MKQFFFIILALCLCSPILLAEKKKEGKMEIDIADMAIRREGSQVLIDGKLRNPNEKPVKKLKVIIEFRDTDNKVISTRNGQVDQNILEPDSESEFHAAVPDTVRAVNVTFRFEDSAGHDLDPKEAKSYVIE